jgi:hypothetical protein
MDFIEVNGIGLRYELSGTGDRTLVLVHEMGGSLESWDGVAPHFSASRRVLRYDTRGAGLSQKIRGELHIDTMADDIAALLDSQNISGKVALAGVAVGGAIGFISPPAIPNARAPSWPAARRPASQGNAGQPRWSGWPRSKLPAWHSRSKIRCATDTPPNFAATSGASNAFRHDGSATIPRATRRSGECSPAPRWRPN